MQGSIAFLAAAASAVGGLPDISINAHIRAREVRIEQQGEAHLRIRAEPSAGDKVDVQRNLPKGQTRYRNLDIKLDAEARIAPPATRTPPPTGE